MEARRDGVEDVSAIELAAGDEVERSDEESDPSGEEYGMRGDAVEGWDGGVPVGDEGMDQVEGDGFAAELDY